MQFLPRKGMFLTRSVRGNYFLGNVLLLLFLGTSLREMILFCLFILSGPQGSLEAPGEMPRRAAAAQAVHNHAGEQGIPIHICFF